MKLHVPAYYVLAVCVFLCGCETIGAFGTGRMTKADVAAITQTGTLGSGVASVDVNSLDYDEDYNVSASRPTSAAKKAGKADAWLEENLW